MVCNNSLLAGHVIVEDQAFVSGNCVVHQFSRLGRLVMVAGLSALPQDVAPFCMVAGMRPARLQGLNIVGLRRADVPPDDRKALKSAYGILFRSHHPLPQRLEEVDRSNELVAHLARFLESSERGVIGFGGGSSRRVGPSQ